MAKRFTRLKHKGVSDERRLPRLGKIRLGIKKKSQRSGNEYPAEVDYFVVPEEVAAVYGDKPKKLDVMIPVNDVEVVMPVALKYYKKAGLYCIGDGEVATRRDEDTGQMNERSCPCDFLDQPGKCRRMAVINVILPKVNMGGVYQIVTGSWNSIVDFQSGMDYVMGLLGRCCMVPLELARVPTEITHTDAKGKTSKQTHYTLRLVFNGDIDFINRLKMETNRVLAGPTYRLPAPDVNPVLDPVDVVVHDEADNAAPAIGMDDEPRPTTATVVDDDPTRGASGAAARAEPAGTAERPTDGPKPSRKRASKKASKKAAKPKPKDESDEKPKEASPGPRSLAEVPGLWKKVKACFGDSAETFWKFVLKSYFGVENSGDVKASNAVGLIERIEKIADMADDVRSNEASMLWEDLRIECDERAAAAAEVDE